jgi:general secretion pathway protein G
MKKPSVGKFVLYVGGFAIAIAVAAGGCIFYKAHKDFQEADIRIQEKVLTDQLGLLRGAIKRYTLEKDAPPQSLSDLVTSGYLRNIPTDPIVGKQDWDVVIGDYQTQSKAPLRGIVDAHSWSNEKSSRGTPYSQW